MYLFVNGLFIIFSELMHTNAVYYYRNIFTGTNILFIFLLFVEPVKGFKYWQQMAHTTD